MSVYTTREATASALDIQAPAYASVAIDRAIESGSRNVDGLCHRPYGFAPYFATHTFDYPNDQTARSGRLWLDDRTLLELTSPTGFLPRPDQSLPYDYIEADRSTSTVLGGGASYDQRAVQLTGRWGYSDDWTAAGTASVLATTTAGTFTSSTGDIGVGSLLRIGTEYLTVTGKSWAASGQLSTVALSADSSDIAVVVTDGTVFSPFETLLIDGERVQVQDINGTTLYVKRAVDGTVLAEHVRDAPVSWARVLTVARGANGSTAATHAGSAPVFMWVPPALVSSLAMAYAQDELLQSVSGYARTIGSGESQQQYSGRGIAVLEKRVYRRYARKGRTRAV